MDVFEEYGSIMKNLHLQEAYDDVVIYNYAEYSKKYDIDDVTDFYNQNFPKSQHTSEFKLSKYNSPKSIVFIAVDETSGVVCGLIESWLSKDGERIFSTALIMKKYRSGLLFRKMFTKFLNECRKYRDKEIIVHFRDSNKTKLEPLYKFFGFDDLEEDGTYQNGEIKWKMTYNL